MMKTMHPALRALLLLFFWAALLLTACAPAATPQATLLPATTVPTLQATPAQPSAAPQNTAAPQVTPSLPATAAPAGGVTTYTIVPAESKVTYEVGETFLNQSNRYNLAVGVTSEVKGTLTGDPNNPAGAQLGPFEIDISKFKSDSDRRDSYIRSNGLESSKYPIAKYVPTKIDTLPGTYTAGQDVAFKVTGDLTVKTTTKPVTWDVSARLENGVVSGKATTELSMAEFNVGPITILGVLNTEDKVKLTFEFVARP